MNKPIKHLFICTKCTYIKPDHSESSPEEAVNLRKNLKNRIRETDKKDQVQVTASGCLGRCEHGISAVLYPEGKWLTNLRPSDEENLFESLIKI